MKILFVLACLLVAFAKPSKAPEKAKSPRKVTREIAPPAPVRPQGNEKPPLPPPGTPEKTEELRKFEKEGKKEEPQRPN